MNYFIFYREITNDFSAVKTGFSFPAFLLGWIWLAWKGLRLPSLWAFALHTIAFIYPYFKLALTDYPFQYLPERTLEILIWVIQNSSKVAPDDELKSVLFIFLTMIYVGSMANTWSTKKLMNAEYRPLGKQMGLNSDDACKIAKAKFERFFEKHSDKVSENQSILDKLKAIGYGPLKEYDSNGPLVTVFFGIAVLVVIII